LNHAFDSGNKRRETETHLADEAIKGAVRIANLEPEIKQTSANPAPFFRVRPSLGFLHFQEAILLEWLDKVLQCFPLERDAKPFFNPPADFFRARGTVELPRDEMFRFPEPVILSSRGVFDYETDIPFAGLAAENQVASQLWQ